MMRKLSGYALAAGLLMAVGAMLAAQTPERRWAAPRNPVGRYTVTSSESATVLLETTTGRTWLLAGVKWLPVEGGPESAVSGLPAEYSGAPLEGDWARLSPFTDVICQSDQSVLVRIDDENRMLQLVSIDGISTQEILATAHSTYGDQWEKRFVEDIVEVLASMGHQTGETVKLVLRDPESGETRTIEEAPMTHENRQRVYAARHEDQ
jgi:hypothetical protein